MAKRLKQKRKNKSLKIYNNISKIKTRRESGVFFVCLFNDILLLRYKGKKKPLIAAYFYCKLRTFDFSATQASGAHVFGSGRTVFIDNFNFVDVRAPRPSGFAMAVAYHITAHLSFSTNAAYSRHTSIPPNWHKT
mgnify:FL=1